jgi:hypothetical protein
MLFEQESRALRLRTASNEEQSLEVVAPEVSGTLSVIEGDTLPFLHESLHELLSAENGIRNRDLRSEANTNLIGAFSSSRRRQGI